MNDQSISLFSKKNEFAVTLPCDPENFSEFISSLLGQPQIIEKFFTGAFEISKNNISNLDSLIKQRINSQNTYDFIQFEAKIHYDDLSSITINSLEQFMHYSEVRPLLSYGLTVSWIYLIKFKTSSIPEKQEITLHFSSNQHEKYSRYIEKNFIKLEIRHTNRTWGEDFLSLISGYINTIIKEETPLKRLIRKYPNKFGSLISGLFFVIFSSVGYKFLLIKLNILKEKYKENLSISIANGQTNKKIDFLIDLFLSGEQLTITTGIFIYLVITLIIGISIGMYFSEKIESFKQPSFILLTDKSIKKKESDLKSINRDWFIFYLAFLFGIIGSIIATIICTTFM